jgi:hypothetical protein
MLIILLDQFLVLFELGLAWQFHIKSIQMVLSSQHRMNMGEFIIHPMCVHHVQVYW